MNTGVRMEKTRTSSEDAIVNGSGPRDWPKSTLPHQDLDVLQCRLFRHRAVFNWSRNRNYSSRMNLLRDLSPSFA